MLKERSTQHRVNHETYAVMLKFFVAEPCTAHDLAEESGLHIITVQHLLRIWKRHRIIHISAWETDCLGRDCTAVFTFGPGKDKKRRQQSRAEIAARHREKKKRLAMQNAVARPATAVKPEGDAYALAA